MSSKLVIALHGFLGQPKDWFAWRDKLCGPKDLFWAPSLWTDPTLNPELSLEDWVDAFCSSVQERKEESTPCELWGYSMGGRLALLALCKRPQLFERAQILSANIGLKNESEKASRLRRDFEWANRFRSEPWDSLIDSWNQQPVLSTSPVDNSVYREEKLWPRERLALALENWSVAKQPSLWDQLPHLPQPIEWHAGALDPAYVKMAQEATALNSLFTLKIHAQKGHRLLQWPS